MILLKWGLLLLVCLAVVAGAGLAAAIAFGTAEAPKPINSVSAPMRDVNYPDRFAPLLLPRRPGTPITVVPNVGHMGLITRPEAIASIVAAVRSGS